MCSCGQHRDVTARFRSAIDLIADVVDASELSQAYKSRSKVVHQGRPSRNGDGTR
jgi:hypothetical protein